MRKVLLSLLFSIFGLYAMGQNALSPGRNLIPANPNQTKTTQSTPYTGWYDILEDAKTTGFVTYTPYNNTVFPDSTVQVLYENSAGNGTALGNVFTNGVGEVLDPTSQSYVTPLSYYNSYSVDSVALFYLYNYVPETDTLSPDKLVHDTLIFQYYTIGTGGVAQGMFAANPGQNFPAELEEHVKYNYQTNLGIGSIGTIKYILGQADTQSLVRNAIQMPVGTGSGSSFVPGAKLISRTIAPKTIGYNDDAFAFTVSYRPGFKWKLNDTIDEQNKPLPKHLHSHFRILIGNAMPKASNTDYEMSLSVVTAVRYNNASYRGGQWPTGIFVPGSDWLGYNQILWTAFHLTTPNLGVQDPADPKGYLLSEVYPNPVHGAAHLDFSVGNPENVTINVYDILGHKVATLANGMYSSGSHTINFDTYNLKEGVYLYKITAGSFTKTLKFTVTE